MAGSARALTEGSPLFLPLEGRLPLFSLSSLFLSLRRRGVQCVHGFKMADDDESTTTNKGAIARREGGNGEKEGRMMKTEIGREGEDDKIHRTQGRENVEALPSTIFHEKTWLHHPVESSVRKSRKIKPAGSFYNNKVSISMCAHPHKAWPVRSMNFDSFPHKVKVLLLADRFPSCTRH